MVINNYCFMLDVDGNSCSDYRLRDLVRTVWDERVQPKCGI